MGCSLMTLYNCCHHDIDMYSSRLVQHSVNCTTINAKIFLSTVQMMLISLFLHMEIVLINLFLVGECYGCLECNS